MSTEDRFVCCPYCDSRVIPGQSVTHVDDADPWRQLWHSICREMWQYDQSLATKMETTK